MATSWMTEQLGRVLGARYRLTAAIGTGSSASVYLADDVTLRRRVAVKILHPALADDEGFLRRFQAEARSAAALSHPNLMAVYDWGEDDGPYLVMEYLGGGSLRAILDEGHRLTPAQAVVVGLDAARALDAAHRRGFVHRDIKPANLLFGEDRRLRIADFGLARALSEAAWTEPENLVGTARYAAPEQVTGSRLDGKADVYALALVLVEAMTGDVPLTGDSALGTLMGRVGRDLAVPVVAGPLRPALEAAGRADPAARPDAGTFGRGLLAAARLLDRPEPLPLVGAGPAPPVGRVVHDPTLVPAPAPRPDDGGPEEQDRPPPVAAEPTTRRRRRRWPWMVLVLALVAGTAGGAWAWSVTRAPSAAVPDLGGRPEAEARFALDEAEAAADPAVEWRVRTQFEVNDVVPAGVVIRQDPVKGSDLRTDGAVTLVVSSGPPRRAVPDLSGLGEAEARAAVEEAELAVGTVVRQRVEDVERDRVVTWAAENVDRPSSLPRGSAIDVVISDGPPLRAIPALAGAAAADAVSELEAMGLVVETEEQFNDDVDEGEVVGTDPGAATQVERGSTVTVVVSRGPDLVTVPEVAGRILSEATRLLRSVGLIPGQAIGPAEGSPFATDVPAGRQVRRGSAVDIYLR